MSVIEHDRDIDDVLPPEIPSRIARLRHWARTHLVLPAILYFALMVSIWYVATHSEAWVPGRQVVVCDEMIDDAVFSPDIATIAVALDTEVRIVNVRSGATVARLPDPRGAPLCFSPDGTRLLRGVFTGRHEDRHRDARSQGLDLGCPDRRTPACLGDG